MIAVPRDVPRGKPKAGMQDDFGFEGRRDMSMDSGNVRTQDQIMPRNSRGSFGKQVKVVALDAKAGLSGTFSSLAAVLVIVDDRESREVEALVPDAGPERRRTISSLAAVFVVVEDCKSRKVAALVLDAET